jgi:hypothetical protein
MKTNIIDAIEEGMKDFLMGAVLGCAIGLVYLALFCS